MWKTLILRPVTRCDGECLGCPFSGSTGEKSVIPVKAIDKAVKALSTLVFDEAVILCPNPFHHPRLPYIIGMVKDVAEQVSLFTPVIHVSRLTRSDLKWIDELVLVASTPGDLVKNDRYIKSLMSQGLENISVYLALRPNSPSMDAVHETIRYCRQYGLRLRLGEPPYASIQLLDLPRMLRRRGYEVTLPHGYRYGYRAMTAWIDGYMATVLAKPLDGKCRKIYIDPHGRLHKCPFIDQYIDLLQEDIDLNRIRRIIYSTCPIKCLGDELIPQIRISLMTCKGVEIPKDILDLLELINNTRSFRTACKLLGYNPSTYIEKIHRLEKRLGFQLIDTLKGGRTRGSTILTKEALRIIEEYRKVREMISEKLFEGNIRRFIF